MKIGRVLLLVTMCNEDVNYTMNVLPAAVQTLDKCHICWMQLLVYTVHHFCQFSLQTHFNLSLQGLMVDVIKLGKPRK